VLVMNFLSFGKHLAHLGVEVPDYVQSVEEFQFLEAYRDKGYVYIRLNVWYRPKYNPQRKENGIFVLRAEEEKLKSPRELAYFYPFLNPKNIRFLPKPPEGVFNAFFF